MQLTSTRVPRPKIRVALRAYATDWRVYSRAVCGEARRAGPVIRARCRAGALASASPIVWRSIIPTAPFARCRRGPISGSRTTPAASAMPTVV